MRGVLFTPKGLKVHNERSELIAKALGFEIRYANDCDPQQLKVEGVDMVLSMYRPHCAYPYSMKGLVDLDKSIGVISFFHDLHSVAATKDVYMFQMRKVLERSDKILCTYDERFRELWPQFLSKYECVPWFVIPYGRYANLPYNNKPIMKALLTGVVGEREYPLRYFIFKLGHPYIERLPYSSDKFLSAKIDIIGSAYVEKLNQYFCSIATSTIYKRVVAKHFEIPAAGALLLADYVEGLKSIGFIENKHYVRIDKNNVGAVIKDVMENPEKYEKIRREGREYILKNHTILNRIKQISRIVREVYQSKKGI